MQLPCSSNAINFPRLHLLYFNASRPSQGAHQRCPAEGAQDGPWLSQYEESAPTTAQHDTREVHHLKRRCSSCAASKKKVVCQVMQNTPTAPSTRGLLLISSATARVAAERLLELAALSSASPPSGAGGTATPGGAVLHRGACPMVGSTIPVAANDGTGVAMQLECRICTECCCPFCVTCWLIVEVEALGSGLRWLFVLTHTEDSGGGHGMWLEGQRHQGAMLQAYQNSNWSQT